MPDSASGSRGRTQYQGKRLFYLMLAICLPAALLYLRLVLGLAASDSRVDPLASARLNRWSLAALGLFFIAQLLCARYLQRLLPAKPSHFSNALQYTLALALGILFSLTGAVMLEAFGLNLFLRAPR
jgi:hypothetical protein